MSLPYSREMLAGALLSKGLSADGDAEELHSRLGTALVKELLTPKRGSKRTADATSAAAAPKRSKSEWFAFMKSEREKVLASGYAGRADILREIARRWKLVKQRDVGNAPAALPPPSPAGSSSDESVPDGLLQAIRELPAEEIAASLEAHGMAVEEDFEANVTTLALTMM
jgi:hypothetical protein